MLPKLLAWPTQGLYCGQRLQLLRRWLAQQQWDTMSVLKDRIPHHRTAFTSPWTIADADFVFHMYSCWEVQRFVGLVPRIMVDRAEAAERITNWQRLDHPVHAIWAVELSNTSELVGTLLLKSIPASGDSNPPLPSGDTEIGWHFHPDYWGNGYASEAASAVLKHGFAGGLDKIVAVTSSVNHAHLRLSGTICRVVSAT